MFGMQTEPESVQAFRKLKFKDPSLNEFLQRLLNDPTARCVEIENADGSLSIATDGEGLRKLANSK